MKKVLLTGADSGIGRQAIDCLLKLKFEVYAVTNLDPEKKINVKWIKADLLNFENVKNIFQEVKPEYLLHLDWHKEPTSRLASDLNYSWFQASLEMLKQFYFHGGKRAVYAGTYLEYELGDDLLNETHTKINPTCEYAKYKNYLNEIATLYAKEKNISFGWGRIFSVYGDEDFSIRIIPHVIKSLMQDKEVVIQVNDLMRDYMFECDVAGAFSKFLDSNIEGSVNICSKIPMKPKDLVDVVGEKLKKTHLIKFEKVDSDKPKIILGDNARLLEEVKYSPKWTLDLGLEHLLKEQKLIK